MTCNRLLIVLSLILFLGNVNGQSLWRPETGNPYTPSTAHHEGDILTVIISETHTIKQDDETETQETSSMKGKLEGYTLTTHAFPKDVFPEASVSSEQKYKGKGKYDKKGSFETRIAVKVVGKDIHGNLLVAGTRKITLDAEDRVMKVSGRIRPDDIQGSNIIYSEDIAGARISYHGNGPITQGTSRGLFGRVVMTIFDFFWPF